MAPEDSVITLVAGEELLHRSVKDLEQHHVSDLRGSLIRLGASAFNDPDRTPSVNRASLRAGEPETSRRADDDGVVTVSADEVRAISCVVTCNNKGVVSTHHEVDVRHVPEPDNYSHALIQADPHVRGDGAWKKLKEALCQLASRRGWSYPPASARR